MLTIYKYKRGEDWQVNVIVHVSGLITYVDLKHPIVKNQSLVTRFLAEAEVAAKIQIDKDLLAKVLFNQ